VAPSVTKVEELILIIKQKNVVSFNQKNYILSSLKKRKRTSKNNKRVGRRGIVCKPMLHEEEELRFATKVREQ
jgi:ribosomal protein L36